VSDDKTFSTGIRGDSPVVGSRGRESRSDSRKFLEPIGVWAVRLPERKKNPRPLHTDRGG